MGSSAIPAPLTRASSSVKSAVPIEAAENLVRASSENFNADTTPLKKSFKQKQFEARELAILDATNRLLATKGFEQMVMDDIATEVGIAKGSLYRHFQSKEELAAAVMTRLLEQTKATLKGLAPNLNGIEKLRALLGWILMERVAGKVPHLPSGSSQLRESLMANKAYMDILMHLADDLGALIHQAKEEGGIKASLPDEFVLYHFYARTCDPTLEFLMMGGSMKPEQIVQAMVEASFCGLK